MLRRAIWSFTTHHQIATYRLSGTRETPGFTGALTGTFEGLKRKRLEKPASLARFYRRYESTISCSTGRMESTPRHKNVNYDFVARALFFHIQNSPAGK